VANHQDNDRLEAILAGAIAQADKRADPLPTAASAGLDEAIEAAQRQAELDAVADDDWDEVLSRTLASDRTQILSFLRHHPEVVRSIKEWNDE
jgi:hypothetical protein